MIYEKIQLFENRPHIFIEAYCADKIWDKKRSAILIIPGGAYSGVCADREGEPIALSFLGKGVNAFVLHYSVGSDIDWPDVLIEASAAMKHIRDNHEKYNIDPSRVFVSGFSAGGHLCTALGVFWHMPEIYEALQMPPEYNKPTGIIPVYPVVSPFVPNAGTYSNLFHKKENPEEFYEKYAPEKNVSEKSAPAFIVHTATDKHVPVAHSLALASAYAEKGQKFELHIYPDAPHGVALGNDITSLGKPEYENKSIEGWVDLAVAWMEQF